MLAPSMAHSSKSFNVSSENRRLTSLLSFIAASDCMPTTAAD